MQRLPSERDAALPAIRRIADQRMPERGQVNAYLMGPTGLEPAGEQRAIAKSLAHFIARHRGFPAGDDRHRRAPDRVTADRRIDRAAAGDVAGGERQIFAMDASCLQLAHQVGLGDFGLGHDQQSARVLVQPMHDARARDGGELRRMVQQRIGKRAVAVAAARVNDQPGRLVDDEDRLVLVHDRQVAAPAARTQAAAGSDKGCTRTCSPPPTLRLASAGAPREQYAAGVDPGADAAARMFGQQCASARSSRMPAHSAGMVSARWAPAAASGL